MQQIHQIKLTTIIPCFQNPTRGGTPLPQNKEKTNTKTIQKDIKREHETHKKSEVAKRFLSRIIF
jgi:hypothetical protein